MSLAVLPLPLLLLLLTTRTLGNDPPLLFAQSSVFQFTVGTATPIATGKRGSLSASVGYQFNYALPWNSSQFEPMVVQARSPRQASSEQRSLHLSDVYSSLENLLDRHGWGEGRECMLRTICELAEAPLDRRADDAVDQIIHLLLTPSEDGESENWSPYVEAEKLGRGEKGKCAEAYAGCLGSALDSFTELALGS